MCSDASLSGEMPLARLFVPRDRNKTLTALVGRQPPHGCLRSGSGPAARAPGAGKNGAQRAVPPETSPDGPTSSLQPPSSPPSPPPSRQLLWPRALRQVQDRLDPWHVLQRCWQAWSQAPGHRRSRPCWRPSPAASLCTSICAFNKVPITACKQVLACAGGGMARRLSYVLRPGGAVCYTGTGGNATMFPAPIAQWIEHRPPEPGAGVRVALGAPHEDP
jgi:hypothetical protein